MINYRTFHTKVAIIKSLIFILKILCDENTFVNIQLSKFNYIDDL